MEKNVRGKGIICMVFMLCLSTVASAMKPCELTSQIKTEPPAGIPARFSITSEAVKGSPSAIQKVPRVTSRQNQRSDRDDFLVLGGDGEYQNPAVAYNENTGDLLVLSEEHEYPWATSILGRWSTAGVWSDEIAGWSFDDSVTQPHIDYYGMMNAAWGTVTPGENNDGVVYYLEFPNIIDPLEPGPQSPDGWTAWSVDWGQELGYTHFDSADVACLPIVVPGARLFGFITVTGDSPSKINTIIITYFDKGDPYILSFTDIPCDCKKIACEIDQSLGRLYIVCEYEHHPQYGDGSLFLYHNITGREQWYRGEWSGYYFEDLFNPSITVDEQGVFLAGQTMNRTQSDILCEYSSDAGTTFQRLSITNTLDSDEFYPCISTGYIPFPQRTTPLIMCSYVRNNNLYTSLFWSNPLFWEELPGPLNDVDGSVVNQYGSIGSDMYLTWTDHRNQLSEIYLDIPIYYPYSWPSIEIHRGLGLRITADILAQDGAAVRSANWTIHIDGGILWTQRNTTGFIHEIPAGTKEAIKTDHIFGIGIIKITVDVTPWIGNHTTETAFGFVVGPFIYVNRFF